MTSKFFFMNHSFLIRFAVVLVFLVISTSSFAKANDDMYTDDNGHGHFCNNTITAALRACNHEVKDDFWIALGNCNNLSDADARKECEKESMVNRQEGKNECRLQYIARREVCELLGEAPYDPQIDPENFVDPTEIGSTVAINPYFPLVPGTTWIYEGGDEIITVTVTENTKEILGVTVAVVHDVVEEDGEVIEDTYDWYAQDINRNVWYFGEIAQEFIDGELVGIEGSWKAGVDGAKAGILVKSEPQVGDVYRQEFALGEAEDLAEVVSLNGSTVVPAASCNNDCMVTRDFTPLEPDVMENKYYVHGIGVILEVDLETGERVELVGFIMN